MLSVPWVVQDNACYGLGTPEDCIATADQFADLGVSHLILAPCCDPEETTAPDRTIRPRSNSTSQRC